MYTEYNIIHNLPFLENTPHNTANVRGVEHDTRSAIFGKMLKRPREKGAGKSEARLFKQNTKYSNTKKLIEKHIKFKQLLFEILLDMGKYPEKEKAHK